MASKIDVPDSFFVFQTLPIFQRSVYGAQYTFLKPNLKNNYRNYRKINYAVEKTMKRLFSVLDLIVVELEANTHRLFKFGLLFSRKFSVDRRVFKNWKFLLK